MRGLTGSPLAKRFFLASPSMLLPSKPLPPIRKSSLSTKPSKILSRELEIGKNVTSYYEDSRKTQEQSSERKGHKVLLTPICPSVGVVKKRSLLPPLIPPIGKAGSPALGNLTERGDPKKFFLDIPYVPLRAKLLPPIQKSSLSSEPSKMCKKKKKSSLSSEPSKMCKKKKKKTKECRENLTVSDDSCRNKELISAGKGCLTGYPFSKKFSLDTSYVPLPLPYPKYLPPIPKSSLSSDLRKKLPPVQRVFKK
ncbi:hypothetical protein EK904_002253 [Melospiza melodia maxima]|nr:hypothetical protein EK904_002253 [Melospiza melodia maxima]